MPTMRTAHPTPPSLGRRARRHAETRARILRAALNLFARQGFFATTVEQITEAADVGKGTFFNYFPTKEHVLAGFGRLQLSKIEAAVASARSEADPVRAVLHRLVHALAEEPARSPTLVRNLLVANLSSEPVRQLMRRNLARGRRLLTQMLVHAQRRGELRRDLKPIQLARLFQQVFFGTLFLWALQPRSRLARWLEPSFDLFWSGIAARPSRRSRLVEARS